MPIDSTFLAGLNIDAALDLLWPVLVVVGGMAAYALFVFKFYRFVAARDMFSLNFSGGVAFGSVIRDVIFLFWYVIRYLILFPAFAFFWLVVLTLILTFLSDGRELSEILLIAMATVCAIRVSAYYNEDLSRDLAKILPFAVLGVFIIDTSFFNVQSSLDTLAEISAHLDTIAYYLAFLIALEFALRLIYFVVKLLFPSRPEPQAAEPPAAHQPTQRDQQRPAQQRPGQQERRPTPVAPTGTNGPDSSARPAAPAQQDPGAGQPAD